MTKQHRHTKPKEPTLEEFLVLHRYARSRHVGEKAAGGTFAAADPDLTADRWWGLVHRLERHFDCYIIKKRATEGREITEDLDWPEEGDFHLESSKSVSLKNKERLTTAGEILGEIASILSGYLAIAMIVVGRSEKTLQRGPERQRQAVRAWLTAERRRLDRIVMAARSSDADVEQFGEWAGEAAFDADPRDIRDMTKHAVSSNTGDEEPDDGNLVGRPRPAPVPKPAMATFHSSWSSSTPMTDRSRSHPDRPVEKE